MAVCWYRCFFVVTMLFLITVSLFQPAFSRDCGKSARKRGRLSMEYLKVQHREGIAEAAVVKSTSDQMLPKLTHKQIQGESTSQKNGQSGSLRQRNMKPKFQCKRQIPGGPDPQHH
ncbi:hypothetical protein SUGI_0783600 [Cryptomeria japonica]|nr:hypothetical protein SUGI_0783600 [Cryptomeria japonica]